MIDGKIEVMTPERRRLMGLATVGVAQIALTAAAFELCSVRTDTSDVLQISCGGEIHGHTATYFGYPVPWMEYHQGYRRPWLFEGPEWVGSTELVSYRPFIPGLMVVLAFTLPPVVFRATNGIYRRLKGEPRLPSSRIALVLRTVLLLSALVLVVLWIDTETYRMTVETPWSQRAPGKWLPGWWPYWAFPTR
jgi:hypothetical protein